MPNTFNAQSREPDFRAAQWLQQCLGSQGSVENPQAQLGINIKAPGYKPFDDYMTMGGRSTSRERDLEALGILTKPQKHSGAGVVQVAQYDVTLIVSNEPRAGEIAMLTVSGTTRTGAGAALASCEVRAYRMLNNTPPADEALISVTTSDGSGNFSFDLAPGMYQFDAYKTGSPDLAGTTTETITPTSVISIYLRDPTAADSGGGFVGGIRVVPAAPRRRV